MQIYQIFRRSGGLIIFSPQNSLDYYLNFVYLLDILLNKQTLEVIHDQDSGMRSQHFRRQKSGSL